MISEPLVSIITPTFNHVDFLPQCISSVLTQTYSNWEQIIWDDGSSDGTWEVATHYSNLDRRIKVFRGSHKGIYNLACIYNQCLQVARGGIMAILEGDDEWPPSKLSNQVPHHVENPNLVLSYGRIRAISQTGKKFDVPGQLLDNKLFSSSNWGDELILAKPITPASVLISRSFLEAIGGFQREPGFPAVDYPTWLKLSELEGQVAYIGDISGFWRRSPGQTTNRLPVELAEGKYDLARRHANRTSHNDEWLGRIQKAHYGLSLVPAHLSQLRSCLLKKVDRDRTLRSILFLLRHGGLLQKVEAIAGFGAMVTGTNLEGLFAFAEGRLENVIKG